MKTKTSGIVIPPKEASSVLRTLAWIIDLGLIAVVSAFVARKFSLARILPELPAFGIPFVLGGIFFFLFIVIPHCLMSQSVGKLLLGLKSLTKNNYRRLSFNQALHYSLPLPGSVAEVIRTTQKKYKNTATDFAFFVIYHGLLIGAVAGFLVFYSARMPVLNLDGLLRVVNIKKESASAEVVLKKPMLKKVTGIVMITNKGETAHQGVQGEELFPGAVIETQSKSSALVVYGNDYLCQIRLSAQAKMNVDELAKLENEATGESSLFNLVRGAMTVTVKDKKKPVEIKVKTKFAVMGVRGTEFIVMVDEFKPGLVAVKEGLVESRNLLNPKTTMVGPNGFLVFNRDGEEKEINDPKAIEQLDWDLESDDWDESSLEEVMTTLGNPVFEAPGEATTGVPAPAQGADDVLNQVKLELETYKIETKFIEEKLVAEEASLKATSEKLLTDRPKIDGDIACVSTSRTPCKLYMEKELALRGFPRTFGTPRLMESIAQDLVKYLREQEEKIDQMRVSIEDLKQVLVKREDVVKEAEANILANTNLEISLGKLKSKDLLRR